MRRQAYLFVRRYALAFLAGAALAFGTPPFDLYPALWLGMAALAWLLEDDPARHARVAPARVALCGAGRGLAFGVGANLVVLRFIPAVLTRFTPLPWVLGALALLLLAVFEGLRWMVAAVACETLARARVPRPLAFAAGVYAGTFVPTMMPWTPAGGVSPWPAMVQLADVVGERGVAAVMALTAGLLATALRWLVRPETRRRGARMLGAAWLLLLAQLVFGAARMAAVDRMRASAPHVRVALVQPSIEATVRWERTRAPAILATLTALSADAESRGADLVVWPETAYPYPLRHGSRREPETLPSILQPTVHGPVLTGVLLNGAEGDDATNSAVVATQDGALSDSYDKRHLLWFGETVPLADSLPVIRRVFARGLGLAAGDRTVALPAGRVRAAVLVCYEDTLPEAGREALEARPNLLVNVTNDAWFSGSAESELHLRVAALRAVEERRELVRAVNFGPSSWVDAAGRVRMRSSPNLPASVLAEPALLDAPLTLYGRFGDAPLALVFLAMANRCLVARGARPLKCTARPARQLAYWIEILQRLERRGAHLLLSRLGLDGDGFLGERVDAGPVLGRRFLDGTELQQPGDHELAVRLAQLLLDELREAIKNTSDALLIELRGLRNLGNDLRLRQTLGRHFGFLLSTPNDDFPRHATAPIPSRERTGATRGGYVASTTSIPISPSAREKQPLSWIPGSSFRSSQSLAGAALRWTGR